MMFCGRLEIRLADLQVDDVAPLGLEPAGVGEHLEGTLGAEAGHPLGPAEVHARTVSGGRSPR